MASPDKGDKEAVGHFNRRVKALKMSMTYQDWLESFKSPFTYDPQKFLNLGLENDYVLHFGANPGGRTLKVPVSFLCSISKPLHDIIANHHRYPRQTPVFDKSEIFAFWWLKNFLRNTCLMPNAAGVAALLTMAHKYDIQPVEHISRKYLYTMVNLDSFPHVLNAALDTDDEEFLTQCSCMVAAWSDELLSSPHISVLSCRAMVYLLDNTNLSPSSELMVYNAITNWARNKDWKVFATEINLCLKKVRYLLFAEDKFQQEVLPAGLFPVKEANMMMRLIRDETGKEGHTVSLVHDPRLQRTPRPVLRRTLVLGKEVPEKEDSSCTYEPTRKMCEHPVCFFKVDKHVLLRRVSSPSFVDEEGGRLHLEERDGFRVENKWIHCSSTFEKPLPLQPNRSYQLVFSSDSGRAEREICHAFEEAVGYVTFKGMAFCSHLSLEFATFQAADAETIDKVWAFMRPTDLKEVIMHKETTLERLFKYEELEEENRRALKAARENQELEDMYKEASEWKRELPGLDFPSTKAWRTKLGGAADECEARRNHDDVTVERISEDLTVVITDSGAILEIRASGTEPDSAAANNAAARNSGSASSGKQPKKVADKEESRRNGDNGTSETEVERAASTNERRNAYNEAPGTEPGSAAAENGVRTNGNNAIGIEPENAAAANGVRTNGNNNEIGPGPEHAAAENGGGRNSDIGAFITEPESVNVENGRTNGDNGTSRAETDRPAAESEAARKRDSGASCASSEDSLEVIGTSEIDEIRRDNDSEKKENGHRSVSVTEPKTAGDGNKAGTSDANGASATEPKSAGGESEAGKDSDGDSSDSSSNEFEIRVLGNFKSESEKKHARKEALKRMRQELAEAMEEDHF